MMGVCVFFIFISGGVVGVDVRELGDTEKAKCANIAELDFL